MVGNDESEAFWGGVHGRTVHDWEGLFSFVNSSPDLVTFDIYDTCRIWWFGNTTGLDDPFGEDNDIEPNNAIPSPLIILYHCALSHRVRGRSTLMSFPASVPRDPNPYRKYSAQ